jgi:hypothetical protein
VINYLNSHHQPSKTVFVVADEDSVGVAVVDNGTAVEAVAEAVVDNCTVVEAVAVVAVADGVEAATVAAVVAVAGVDLRANLAESNEASADQMVHVSGDSHVESTLHHQCGLAPQCELRQN